MLEDIGKYVMTTWGKLMAKPETVFSHSCPKEELI